MKDGERKRLRDTGQRLMEAGHPLAAASGLFVVAVLWVLALRGADIVKAIDLTGVFCFAYVAACGTWKMGPRNANMLVKTAVVTVAALLTGCGGGALMKNPALYGEFIPYPIQQPEYLAAVAAAVLLSIVDLQARITRHDDIAAAGDAIAHALFAYSAAQTAITQFGSTDVGVIAAIFAAFFSTAGGGILRDIILDQVGRRSRSVFEVICTPYRWAALFSAVLVVTSILILPRWSWAGATLSGLLVYAIRNLTLSKA